MADRNSINFRARARQPGRTQQEAYRWNRYVDRVRNADAGGAGAPIDPTWLLGTGSPVIDGADVLLRSTASDVAYSDVVTFLANDNEQKYMEFLIGDDFDIAVDKRVTCGVKSAFLKAGVPITYMFAFQALHSTSVVRMNVNNLSTTIKEFSNIAIEAILPGTVIGIALDGVGNKLYCKVDDEWATDGVNGGAPSTDNGWAMQGSTSTVMHLQTQSASGGTGTHTVTYWSSGFLPTGYTQLGV